MLQTAASDRMFASVRILSMDQSNFIEKQAKQDIWWDSLERAELISLSKNFIFSILNKARRLVELTLKEDVYSKL